MYQVITETIVDGKRDMDSVSTKIYSKKGFAKRNAKRNTYTLTTPYGTVVERRSYVVGILTPVSIDDAKDAYCKCKSVWVDGEYGKQRIPNSWEYGSHAPAEELFCRSIEQSVGYRYNGNYYVEME